MLRIAMFVLSAAALTTHCGPPTTTATTSTGSTGACDFRKTDVAYCQEYTASTSVVAQYQKSCEETANTTWIAGACPHTDSVGGCTFTTSGTTVTNWFYSGVYTTSTLPDVCTADGKSSYVAP